MTLKKFCLVALIALIANFDTYGSYPIWHSWYFKVRTTSEGEYAAGHITNDGYLGLRPFLDPSASSTTVNDFIEHFKKYGDGFLVNFERV